MLSILYIYNTIYTNTTYTNTIYTNTIYTNTTYTDTIYNNIIYTDDAKEFEESINKDINKQMPNLSQATNSKENK